VLFGLEKQLETKQESPPKTGGESLPSRYRPANRQSFTRFRKFLRARMISNRKYPGTAYCRNQQAV
jgi:hypothetical protein